MVLDEPNNVAQHHVTAPATACVKKRPVDLYKVEIDKAKQGQARETRSKIIKPYRDTERLQPANAAQFDGSGLNFLSFGNLKRQSITTYSRFRKHGPDFVRKPWLSQLNGRDVDAHKRQICIGEQLATGLTDGPVTQLNNLAVFLCNWYEPLRWNLHTIQHSQSHQSLNGADFAGLKMTYWLINEGQQSFLNGEFDRRVNIICHSDLAL